MRYTNKQREELLLKQEQLRKAGEQLKIEFVGLDDIIDEVINTIRSWYLFPDLQEKPVVVNLWGLTGTGKSSLVNRLVELLGYESDFLRFDLGEKERSRCIKEILNDIYLYLNAKPLIIAFDEFQHARSIDEMNKEVNHPDSRIIWELLDSGYFQFNSSSYHLDEIRNFIETLGHFLLNGLRTSKGKVLSNKISYINDMDMEREYMDYGSGNMKLSSVKIVPPSFYDKIYDIAKFLFKSPFEIKRKLLQLDGPATLRFLEETVEASLYPHIVDCSRSLIFVLGNLDEAYTMTRNFNTDMDADEFHELSLKINIPQIKAALKLRLRSEQISRLGNTHIIYPAFSKASFKKIINLELDKVALKVHEQQGVILDFDDSIKDIIYKEGVYPTQGTRPVFTTVNNIVKTKLAGMVTEMVLKNVSADKVRLSFLDGKVLMDYFLEEKPVHRLEENQVLKLENLRICKKDDMQAITAVHEAGHAIISSVLLKTVPEVVMSTVAENERAGFVYTKFKWKYVSRKEILNRLALNLAGYAAEKVVFGEDNITAGADDDIEKATTFTMEMLKSSGMGLLTASYQVQDFRTNLSLHDIDNRINSEAEQCLTSALELAEKTLMEQETLLIRMADHLSDNRQLQKPEIKEMLEKYANNFDTTDLIENGDHLFYRKHLKSKIQKIEEGDNSFVMESGVAVSLNKSAQVTIE